jgi:beta-phosphoglucomutase-like phosphatase (HAD superfamily)
VFEDAEAGIEAAKRAGIKVVALATTFSREFLATTDADVIVDDFTQVNVDMLRRIVEA